MKTTLQNQSIKAKDLIIGSPFGNKKTIVEVQGFKNSSAVSKAMVNLEINNSWIEQQDLTENERRMLYKWKSGANIPKLSSLKRFFGESAETLGLLFVARAVDDFRKNHYEFFSHLIDYVLTEEVKKNSIYDDISNEDQKVLEMIFKIQDIRKNLLTTNKNLNLKQNIKNKLELHFSDTIINCSPQVQAWLHRVQAMYYLFDGDRESALREIKLSVTK